MTNNLDDFDQPELEGNGAPPPKGARANLAHAWRTRPLFKLVVLMIVVGAVLAVAISIFSQPPKPDSSKIVTPPSGMNQPPGGAVTPYFHEQLMKADAEREQKALQTGGSAIPTPVGKNTNIDDLTADKNKKDPLVELRTQIDQQRQKIAELEREKKAPPAPAAAKPEQFDDSLASAMQKQMQQLMGSWDPKGIKQVVVTESEKPKEASLTMASNSANGTSGAAGGNTAQPKIIVPAGTVSYAQLLTEANSDVPGPILAQILSGPLKGARAVGQFKVENEYLVLKFNLVNYKNKDYTINAIALDPDTTLGGMATEVDQRYLTRVLLPAAAGFMQGFASALGQGSSSVVTNGDTTIVQQSGKGLEEGLFSGLGQAGQTLGQFFQNQANATKPLVRVAAGTPMGMFFITSVTDRQPGANDYMSQQQGYPGAAGSPYGSQASGYYPGTSMSGFNNPAGQAPSGSVPYPQANQPYGTSYGGQSAFGSPGYYSTSPYGIGTTTINP
ncbi:MAG: TrbI/VirB10 family protein [Bdellovibrionales bacterium]